MDFINTAMGQISDLFKSMTPGARITAGLLLVVVVVSLGYLVNYQVSGSDAYLFDGEQFSVEQARTMALAFGNAGLTDFQIDGGRIRVSQQRRAEYLKAIANSNAVLSPFGESTNDMLGEKSMFEGRDIKNQRLKAHKEDRLKRLIQAADDIEWASVVFDTATKPGFIRETINTASVTVKPVGAGQLDETRVAKIRYQVASAYAGLKSESVTITDNNGYSYPGENKTGDVSHKYAEAKNRFEIQWNKKILNALAYVKGVSVTSDVVLEPEYIDRTTAIKYDPKTTPVYEKTTSRDASTDEGVVGGQVGLSAQAMKGQTLAPSSAPGMSTTDADSESVTQSLPSTQKSEQVRFTDVPQRVSVSVVVPVSYYRDVWKERNPTKEGEDPKEPEQADLDQLRTEIAAEIRSSVVTLLPTPEGITDKTELVSVTTFQDIKPEAAPEPGMSDNAMAWFGRYWGTVGMIGLAGISLMMLRSMARSAPVSPLPGGGASGDTSGDYDDSGERQTVPMDGLSRFTGSGTSLRDELGNLVQENPEAAVNVLKGWIGNVG
ncbi:MAG: hypothetical protein HQ567_31115 [Candidatus Nealsonbacteria bacterium]|nr:hypothetical protein [Candidatus Nealsonbacteria bacterium]